MGLWMFFEADGVKNIMNLYWLQKLQLNRNLFIPNNLKKA